jgi:hypothetical protein
MDAAPDAPLQFDKAEFAGGSTATRSCAACTTALAGEYYEVNGQDFCAGCTADAQRVLASKPGASGFVKALAGGLAGGIAGALLYYAVLALSGYQLGIIAIAVGFLVGKGVQWGTGGRGGPLYQAMAIVLTYVAIVSTYVPFASQDVSEPTAEHATAPASALLQMLARPFLDGVENVIGLFIIGIGLFEAWKINKRVTLTVSGPFQAAPATLPPVPPAAPAIPGA